MLFIEIALVIAAWRRGWRGWALLPVAIGLAIGMFMGVAAQSSGTAVKDLVGVAFLCDLVVVGILVTMCAKPRKVEETATAPVPESSFAGAVRSAGE